MRTRLTELLREAPPIAPRLRTDYLAMTQEALGNLIALAHDVRLVQELADRCRTTSGRRQ